MQAQPAGRHLPLRPAAGHRSGQAGEEVGTTDELRAAVTHCRAQLGQSRSFIVVNQSTVTTRATTGPAAVQPTLSMLGITKHYDAIAALTDVSFDVLPG